MGQKEQSMNLPNPMEDQIGYYEALIKNLKAIATQTPALAHSLRPLIEHHERQITALTAVEALEKAPTGQMTLGYQRTTYGTMKPRPVVLGSEHRTRTNLPSYPGGPDVRIDPPYDR